MQAKIEPNKQDMKSKKQDSDEKMTNITEDFKKCSQQSPIRLTIWNTFKTRKIHQNLQNIPL